MTDNASKALAMMDHFCRSDDPMMDELKGRIVREFHRMDRIQKREDYSKNLHENCTYCRKCCKLFKTNKCFDKSTEEQMTCEHFDKDYKSCIR